jgi:hypothetical protein
MKKLFAGIVCMTVLSATAFAQAPNYNPTSILFTIGKEQVSAGEFVKVYQKTNVNGEADFSEKSLRDYLDLYVFASKLKKQRHEDGYKRPVLNEFKTYRSAYSVLYV